MNTMKRICAVLATGAMAMAAAVAPAAIASAADTAAMPADDLFPFIGNTGYDAQHYDIDLAYDNTDGSITAKTTMTAVATQDLDTFSLDFFGLTIDAGTVKVNGDAATFSRNASTKECWVDGTGDKAGSTVWDVNGGCDYKLRITPATPIKAGSTFTAEIPYHGVPTMFSDADGGKDGWVTNKNSKTGKYEAAALSEPAGAMTWYPNNNRPGDKATYDIEVTVPSDIKAASNGTYATTDNADGTTTWHWTRNRPTASYLVLMAIGDYTQFDGTVALADGRTIPVTSFVDPAQATDDFKAKFIDTIPGMIQYLEKTYGPYQGDATGIVVKSADVGYALETQDRPYFDGWIDQGTEVHEFAHQWFGDSVSPMTWNDIWQNEAFADYASTRWWNEAGQYLDDAHKDTRYIPTIKDASGKDVTAPKVTAYYAYDYANSPDDEKHHDLWYPATAALDGAEDIFGSIVYERGAMALSALQTTIGDAKFDKLANAWTTRYAQSSATTQDFVTLLRQTVDPVDAAAAEKVFDTWFLTAGRPAAWPSALPAPTPVAFADVDGDTAHRDDIDWIAAQKIAAGYDDGTFGGMRTVVRQDMAAFLYRLDGSPAYEPSDADRARFTDVNDSTPHAKEIWWLASTGIAEGYRNADGTYSFGGMRSVVRQDMAAFLKRFADYRGATPRLGEARDFTDVEDSSAHAAEIAWLSQTGVAAGYDDGTFGGMRSVVRQDMAAFLHRMRVNVLA